MIPEKPNIHGDTVVNGTRDGACDATGDPGIITTEGCMTWGKSITIIAASALCLGLGACNMYVIDFENKLPDGSVLAPKVDTPPPPPPEPLEGSEQVSFMDGTTAQLDGCRVITGMRLSHSGPFEDGLVKLRNTAMTINANRIIPLRLVESVDAAGPHHFSVKMVRCPDDIVDTQQEAANG